MFDPVRACGRILVALLVVVTALCVAPGVQTSARSIERGSAPRPLGTVRAIIHGLTVTPPGRQAGHGAVKESVFSRYALRTGAGQLASVGFADGTVLHMNQLTDAELTSPTSTHVTSGQVEQIVRPGSTHTVTTVSATASAIGTNWDTACTSRQCVFAVIEGAVVVAATVRVAKKRLIVRVLVTTGYETTVVPGKAPTTPVRFGTNPTAWAKVLPPPSPALPINLALSANGGNMLTSTGVRASPTNKWDMTHVIDGDLTTGWQSSVGEVTHQSLVVGLPGTKSHQVIGIVLDPAATGGQPAADAVKSFSVAVSTDGKKFTVVYRGSTTSETGLQSFNFPSPVQAAQVEFVARSNWGGASGVAVAELEVVGFRHTSSSGSTNGTSLLDGGWTYYPDTQTLVMLFGSPGGSGTARLQSLIVNNLPAVNAVTYANIGFVTVHPITPKATLLPARTITLPASEQFGFSVSPIPASAISDTTVYTAVVHTSAGVQKVRVRPAPRRGSWTERKKTLTIQIESGTVDGPVTGNTLTLPSTFKISTTSTPKRLDGLQLPSSASATNGEYSITYPGGVPDDDSFTVHPVAASPSDPYVLALSGGTGRSVTPIILRRTHAFIAVGGDRIQELATYTYPKRPSACPGSIPSRNSASEIDILSFTGRYFHLDGSGGAHANGTIKGDGAAHATGSIGSDTIAWTAALKNSGVGTGTEVLKTGGCSVTVRFSLAPMAPRDGASGTLSGQPQKVSLTAKASTSRRATFTNHGSAAVIIGAVWVTGDAASFHIVGGTCVRGLSLAPGKTCTLAVIYDPAGNATGSADLILNVVAAGKVTTGRVTLAGHAPKGSAVTVSTAVQELFAAINRNRHAHGLAPLTLSSPESVCSARHSRYMANVRRLTHSGFPADICLPHVTAGENVSADPSLPVTTAVLHMHARMITEGPCPSHPCTPSAFLKHSHFEYLMSTTFTEIGIGVYVHGGETWLTEDFFKP
jgi:uncharacterized protein YkwD